MTSLPNSSTLSSSKSTPPLPTTRVDRLLRERIRRNRSHQAFDFDEAAEEATLQAEALPEGPPPISRLVVVANRLPVTCSKDAGGNWQLQASAGGLVSALKGVTSYTALWIGWPGIWVKPGRDRDQLTNMLRAEGYSPVWVDPTLLDLYYNGFCNSVLWQLFHYVPLNIDSWQKMAEHRAMQMQWSAYQVANQKFADCVLQEHRVHDVVWVQDYHLMLLPQLLKQAIPKMKVGFFLHTPFPSSEIYRTLPVREEVLRAVLAADLVGFHTYDYARHFISSCTRILGLEGTPEGVENNGILTRVGTFPIGIDPERFTHALETDEVQVHTARLLNRYAGRKIMLGVDRLDMVKGIPQKLLAYEKFLEEHPEWRDKVLLVQIAVPSRTDVPEYQKLRSMVHEIVGRINGQYGTLTYMPISHLDTSLSFTELCALYAVTDVALVTSLRDGMNLVSYEYVACQSDNAGVLVLSEFAGAAQSLGAGALLVNPWNITDVANAIHDALSMSEDERRERHRQNYMHVQTHTAQHWADTFITELNDTHIEADLRMRHTPPPLNVHELVAAYMSSRRRLIVLGYNATLTTAAELTAPRMPKRHFEQVKALAKVNPRVLQSLYELCQDPNNVIVIFSGSETSKLDENFGHMPVWLAAENGVYVRPPAASSDSDNGSAGSGSAGAGGGAGAGAGPAGSNNGSMPARAGGPSGSGRSNSGTAPTPAWRCVFDQIHRDWMESVQLVFDYFCERTPRSFVEARDTSLVWNYKYADVEFGRIQARDLLQHLWTGPISNAPVEIIQGGKSVEVRPVGVTKGLAMQRLLGLIAADRGVEAAHFDLVLCIGHLLGRDENLFSLFEGARIDGNATSGHSSSRAERFQQALATAAAAMHQAQAQAAAAAAQQALGGARLTLSTSPPSRSHLSSGLASPFSTHPQSQFQPQPQPQLLPQVLHRASGGGAAASLAPLPATPSVLPQHHRSNSTPLEGLSPHAQDRERSHLGQSALAQALASSRESLQQAAAAGPPSVSGSGAAQQLNGMQLQAAARASVGRLARSGGSLQVAGSQDGKGSGNASGALVEKVSSFLPPKYLFTCTVGRNRSKARYALAASSDVADLLDVVVQQGIHRRLPPTLSSCSLPNDHLAMSGSGRMDSFASSEHIAPGPFTLLDSWKHFRSSREHQERGLVAMAVPEEEPTGSPRSADNQQHRNSSDTSSGSAGGVATVPSIAALARGISNASALAAAAAADDDDGGGTDDYDEGSQDGGDALLDAQLMSGIGHAMSAMQPAAGAGAAAAPQMLAAQGGGGNLWRHGSGGGSSLREFAAAMEASHEREGQSMPGPRALRQISYGRHHQLSGRAAMGPGEPLGPAPVPGPGAPPAQGALPGPGPAPMGVPAGTGVPGSVPVSVPEATGLLAGIPHYGSLGLSPPQHQHHYRRIT